jgi:hypothetical protein
MGDYKVSKSIFLVIFAISVLSCAPLQPPSATGPRPEGPPYPVLFSEDIRRKDSVLTALNKLSPESGHSRVRDLELQPITATIENLPASSSSPLYLPRVGAQPVMNEEETRESLRRFIKDWQQLIGSDPAKLSLVQRVDQPDGSKVAIYEQRPFRYPIRGNYGKLQIHFASNRLVLNLSSSCIPDADRIQTALAALTVRVKAEDAIKQLSAGEAAYTDGKGNKVNIQKPQLKEGNPHGLVTYILPSTNPPDALEFHLAWEIELTGGVPKMVYIDALTGEIVGAQ